MIGSFYQKYSLEVLFIVTYLVFAINKYVRDRFGDTVYICLCVCLCSGLALKLANTWPVCKSTISRWFHCLPYCAL